MEAHLHEWLNLTVRWLHVIFGVAWIGASFYFNWLENRLNRNRKGLPQDIAGDLWAVHGGGFYYLRKYKVAPAKVPEDLHWFKWEAYLTWISGFSLLAIVYYWNADAYMVNGNYGPSEAVGLGLLALVSSWIFYDSICKTRLVDHSVVFGLIVFSFFVCVAWFLVQVMSPRAAYIHIGAMIGTCMVGNVFFGIIPAQKELVRAAQEGRSPNAKLGKNALRRSRHNNYFTLPVLFIMVSNHYPSTFGHDWNWVLLAFLSVVGVGVRHYFNIRHKEEWAFWILPIAALLMLSLAFVTAPRAGLKSASVGAVRFHEVRAVVNRRCTSCHSSRPSDEIFRAAPLGVMFDTEEQIRAMANQIKRRAVVYKTMPLGNKTRITEEERNLLGRWVDQISGVR